MISMSLRQFTVAVRARNNKYIMKTKYFLLTAFIGRKLFC